MNKENLLNRILDIVLTYHNKERESILTKGRQIENVVVRQRFCAIVKELQSHYAKETPDSEYYYVLNSISLSDIGNMINRDHASVLHGIKAVKADCAYNKSYKMNYEILFDTVVNSLSDNQHILRHKTIIIDNIEHTIPCPVYDKIFLLELEIERLTQLSKSVEVKPLLRTHKLKENIGTRVGFENE